MSNEVTDYTPIAEGGALPSLDAQEPVLGAPESKVKSKTNVGKLAILGMVLAGFLFIIAGLLIYQKNRKASTPTAAEKAEASKPGFASKNSAVESDSIDRTKAELKKKEAEEQARLKAIEDAQADAQKAAEAEAAKKAAMGQQPGQATTPPAQQNAAAGGGSGQPAPPRPMTPQERKMASGVLLENTGTKPAAGSAQLSEKDAQQRELAARMAALGYQPNGQPLNAPGAGGGTMMASFNPSGPGVNQGGGQGGGNDALSSRLQPTVLQARSAGKLPNLSFLLKKGTTIPCALKTGIDTTLPGFVMCVVLNDVYSANGKTLLVERGATVFGEQQSSLKQGQERTFVVWTRIDNPSGIFANIDSPATDQMGYSGIPGYVDTHFWQRFGGAIMMSLIKDFSSAYSQRLAKTSATATTAAQQPYQNTQQATQDMASEALRNSINIPPTLVVNPATVVNVLVARDVSFENVFGLVD